MWNCRWQLVVSMSLLQSWCWTGRQGCCKAET